MTMIHIESVSQAVSKGTLLELAIDYRTSRIARSCLPKPPAPGVVISSTAFRRHLQEGTAHERQLRLEAVCNFLSKVLGLTSGPAQTDHEFRFPGDAGAAKEYALKLEWHAASNYWVLLLPDEQLQYKLSLS
jgi:hypothetical protein